MRDRLTSLAFLGTGKISTALISSISKNKSYEIIAANRSKEKLTKLKKSNPKIIIAKDNADAVRKSEVIFICMKPQDIDGVLDEIKGFIDKNKLIVSIVAGISIKHIESKLMKGNTLSKRNFSQKIKIIRLMPNINCIVGEMACGVSFNKNIKEEDIKKIKKILSQCGKLFIVEEKLMHTITAISGSGPAFFAYFTGLMIDAGIKNGLDRKIAMELAVQTAFGTAKLMSEKKISAEDLIKIVASPNGTTMAGLSVLDGSDLKLILNKTISASIRRSKELSVE